MSFFFVSSFVALQLLMMYKVGELACVLKYILSNSCSISIPSGVIGSIIKILYKVSHIMSITVAQLEVFFIVEQTRAQKSPP